MDSPTDEQLVNFAALRVETVSGYPAHKGVIASMFARHPDLKERWLDEHRSFQEQLDTWRG